MCGFHQRIRIAINHGLLDRGHVARPILEKLLDHFDQESRIITAEFPQAI